MTSPLAPANIRPPTYKFQATIGITEMQENLGRDDLIEELYWHTSIYANETINFQIWPSAIVGAGSFWNYQSKLSPDQRVRDDNRHSTQGKSLC